MIQHFSDLEIIARTLYGEARGEVNKTGVLALESICSVIWNRWQINPKRFGDTPREVCLKPYQFSCWNECDVNLPAILSSEIHDSVYELCTTVADAFLLGRNVDVINGADHYHSLWIDPPNWAVDIQPIIDIGNHRFYKLS